MELRDGRLGAILAGCVRRGSVRGIGRRPALCAGRVNRRAEYGATRLALLGVTPRRPFPGAWFTWDRTISRVYALDASTGDLIWSYETGDRVCLLAGRFRGRGVRGIGRRPALCVGCVNRRPDLELRDRRFRSLFANRFRGPGVRGIGRRPALCVGCVNRRPDLELRDRRFRSLFANRFRGPGVRGIVRTTACMRWMRQPES